MTKELIEKRIADLTAEAEKFQANLNAIAGAIQDCKWWLNQLGPKIEKPENVVDFPKS